ncbi:ABC transporter permease [Paraflavitalea sp. CAU 1676]|uniref:ABC transporter permease n=1 Tax=Paraflavitalea sp. CAU 1676 TaxID=3032598 RepID=UPI0023D9B8AF|nr:ABC transporter permease [Paraflavitalea sp. CAU 1676]MDF2188108.1 ABC transporter permease [Paraflavitalea sp. CAU 1676]
MFRNYFKTAFRNFRRNKAYSIINILGLSIGLACGMLIILYVKDELSFDRFHVQKDNIYRIGMKRIKPDGSVDGMGGYTGYFPGPRFKANIPEIRAFVRVQANERDVQTGQDMKSQGVHLVDSNFFSVFSFPLLSGNPRTALRDPQSVVITEEIAERQFGTTEAMGKTIMIRDEEDKLIPYTVTGVAKECPQNSSLKFKVLLPLVVSAKEEAQGMNWLNFFLNTFVVMQPGADTKAVEAKMKRVYEADAKDAILQAAKDYGDNSATFYNLQPLTDIHLSKDYKAENGLTDASNPTYSYILSGIALFILLIACINFVNLTVARSIKRAKEIGIRKVIGGERRQLIFQFLGESFFLSLLAFLLAIALVQLSLPMFNKMANKALSLSYLLDFKLVAGFIGLFLVTTLLAGFYPSLVLSAYNPVKTLYSRFTLAGKNYLQKSLVVLQFGLASFLIVGTIVIYTQFNYLTREPLGYDDSNLVWVGLPNIHGAQAQVYRNELLKNNAITQVSFKNGGGWFTVAKVNGDKETSFAYETIDDTYIPSLKIPVIQGRNFSGAHVSDSTKAVVVNEEFVKRAGWKSPIGQEVNFWYNNNEKYTVVGVVKNYHFESLSMEIKPQLFTMKPSHSYGRAYIKIKPGTATAALRHIEKVSRSLYPLNPYAYVFKDDENLKYYEWEARWKNIILFGAVLTIFVSCIGLFGLSVLSAEKRVKEIGVRKVLGASVSNVVAILSKDFMKLVSLALVFSLPLAWFAANKWLENYPYRIHMSWWMLALGALLVILIALITVSFNAIKAAVANPVKSLRSE